MVDRIGRIGLRAALVVAVVALLGATSVGVASAADDTGAAAGNDTLPGISIGYLDVHGTTKVAFVGLWPDRTPDGFRCSAFSSGCGRAPERGADPQDLPVHVVADRHAAVQIHCYKGNYYWINAGQDVVLGRTVTHPAGWAVWTQVQPTATVRQCPATY